MTLSQEVFKVGAPRKKGINEDQDVGGLTGEKKVLERQLCSSSLSDSENQGLQEGDVRNKQTLKSPNMSECIERIFMVVCVWG